MAAQFSAKVPLIGRKIGKRRMLTSSKIRTRSPRNRGSLAVVAVAAAFLVAFRHRCAATGLEQQPRRLPIRGRPFSGGVTRLTSSLPTEEGEEGAVVVAGAAAADDVRRRSTTKTPAILASVAGFSCLNVVFNLMRPDPDVGVIPRLPRVFWEVCIGCVAAAARAGGGASILQLVLCMMLCPTALIDIFFWGPVLGATTSFESCTGGFLRGPKVCSVDYGKGIGRLAVMVQSVFGGTFYLLAAATCWCDFWQAREEAKEEARARARIVDFSYEH